MRATSRRTVIAVALLCGAIASCGREPVRVDPGTGTHEATSPGDDATAQGGPELLPVQEDPDGGGASGPPATTGTIEEIFLPPHTYQSKLVKPFSPKECAPFFDQNVLQTIEIQIDPAEWSKLQYEYQNVQTRLAQGLNPNPYHPLKSVTAAGATTTEAMIRLRGNTEHWGRQPKMQFQISFNEKNKDARFLGLRKIVLDEAHYNWSYLRDRLAMSVYRELGAPASCENHAKLYVNGSYYGLFGNIEKVDHEFLERNFADPSRNLYKKQGELKTNEDDVSSQDDPQIKAFWNAKTVAQLDAVTDLDALALALAGEAVFPDADGYWAGGWNMYLYDARNRGFVYIPYDVDLAFDNQLPTVDPITWHKDNDRFNGRPLYEMLIQDPAWKAKFIEDIALIRSRMKPSVINARIDDWYAQIRKAAYDDPNKPFTNAQFDTAVHDLKTHIKERAAFLDAWLCANGGPCH